MLIGIVPRGKILISRVWCDPEVFASETGALHDVGFRMSKGKRVLAGKEFVPHRLTDPVLDCWIDDLPVTGREWIDHLLCLRLAGKQCCFGEKGVAVRVLRTDWLRL